MAHADSAWTASDGGVAGHPLPIMALVGHPEISIAFMRLPDGWMDGAGVAVNGNESLQKLWQGSLASIHAVDGSSNYARADVISALSALLTAFHPDTIRTQDFDGQFGDGDHSDHLAVALFTREAERGYGEPHVLVGYRDYETANQAQNVSGTDLAEKRDAFLAYLAYDPAPCGSPPDCGDNRYAAWLARQYRLSGPSGSGGGGGAGVDLRLSGALDHPSAPVGDGLVWRLRVDDVNGAAAVGAYVDLDLPAGAEVASATTDRGPGCTRTSPKRLHCSLDYLSAMSPVGNVLLITKVTQPGELVLSATAGAGGADLTPGDNAIVLRANLPARTAPFVPPLASPARPLLRLVPASNACTVGADGTATATATVVVDRPAALTVVGRRRSGRLVQALGGSRLADHTLAANAPKLTVTIAVPGPVQLEFRIAARRFSGPRPCAAIVIVKAQASGPEVRRIRFLARPG
jgi:hypothetical protein